MSTTENKLQKIKQGVEDFLNSLPDEKQKADAKALCAAMEELTGKKPEMWGYSIVGFGNYHYKYESGREGDAGVIGFAPRKHSLVLYIVDGYDDYGLLLDKLGKHKIGKSCLYINKLSDIDMDVLKEMMKQSIAHLKKKYPTDLE